MNTMEFDGQDGRNSMGDERTGGNGGIPCGGSIMGCKTGASGLAGSGQGSARKTARGFTLIELMLVVAVAGILSGVAYPSFMGQVQKMRRTDAMVSLMQIQVAQERWRSGSTTYGTLSDIAFGALSHAGHYALSVGAQTETSYEVLATAQGSQAHDAPCRYLKLRVDGANLVQASGPDNSTGNAASVNRQCWSV